MQEHLGLIEVTIVFCVVLAVLIWDLLAVKRELRADAEKARAASASDDQAANSG
jgi:hypothetical protein